MAAAAAASLAVSEALSAMDRFSRTPRALPQPASPEHDEAAVATFRGSSLQSLLEQAR
jgi:hypothetical protein